MEGLAQFEVFMSVLLYICGAVVAVAGLIAVVVKFWKWAHKTSDENATSLKEVEGYLASDKRRIEALERAMVAMDEQNKLILTALNAILDHEIDGNNSEKLEASKEAIDKYMFDHVSTYKR